MRLNDKVGGAAQKPHALCEFSVQYNQINIAHSPTHIINLTNQRDSSLDKGSGMTAKLFKDISWTVRKSRCIVETPIIIYRGRGDIAHTQVTPPLSIDLDCSLAEQEAVRGVSGTS